MISRSRRLRGLDKKNTSTVANTVISLTLEEAQPFKASGTKVYESSNGVVEE